MAKRLLVVLLPAATVALLLLRPLVAGRSARSGRSDHGRAHAQRAHRRSPGTAAVRSDGRRQRPAGRFAAGPDPPGLAAGDHRHRGPQLLPERRGRCDRHPPRLLDQPARRRGPGRRQHHHPAGDAQCCCLAKRATAAHPAPQAARELAGLAHHRAYTKEEILALYLNHSYYGAMAYGVEAAAQTYFGKPAAELSLAEVGPHRRPAPVARRLQPLPRIPKRPRNARTWSWG